jgi:hypothetical protein
MKRSPGLITWAGLAIVALAAAVLSFASLRNLASVCGTPSTLAWLLPVCIDAAALVATRVWLSAGSPSGAVHQARLLALGALALSVLGNAADHALTAYKIVPPWWGVVAVGAIPPAVLGGVAHLVGLLNVRNEEPQVTEPGDDLVGRARFVVAAGEAEGKSVGRGTLAKELGITENQARQVLADLRQEQRPTLSVAGEQR